MSTSILREEWRPVQGFEKYEVSNYGRVGSWRSGYWRILKPNGGPDRYFNVKLRRDNRTFTFEIHRLVLETFVGPRPKGMECRHLDGNKHNNCATNLQWGTRLENADDQRRHGTRPIGERVGGAKLTENDVREIRRRWADGERQGVLAADFRISRAYVSTLCSGDVWRHIETSFCARDEASKRLRGSEHGMAKLTTEQAKRVRASISDGTPVSSLAAKFGVTESAIRRIKTGKSWAHLQ